MILFEIFVERRGEWLTLNKQIHHMAEHRERAVWKSSTDVAVAMDRRSFPALEAVIGRRPGIYLPPAVLEIELRFKRGNRRDPHNFQKSIKPVVDHLVSAWGLWPDDTPKWLSQPEPTISTPHPIEGIYITARTRDE